MKTLWAWLINFITHAQLGGLLMGKLCSFNCLRWSLIFLNIFYITLGLILIGLVIATRTLTYMSEPHVLIVTAVAGSILVLLAIFGMIGAVRHNQVILFFYMIVLGLSLLFMFAVSVAALVTPKKIQESALATSWAALSDSQKSAIQISLNCCGFNNVTQNNSNSDSSGDMHPSCHVEPLTSPEMCCAPVTSGYVIPEGRDPDCPNCLPCYDSWKEVVHRVIRLSGGFGLVFSFTQIIGIVLTLRYRNEKDPSINPRAIL